MVTVGRKPGCKKTGGRVPGSQNKRNAEFAKLIEATGFQPLEALCEVGNNAMASGNSEMVFACAKELLPYLHPKKKAIEVTGVDAAPVDFHINIGGALTLSDSLQLIQDAADGPLPEEEVVIEHPEPVAVEEPAPTHGQTQYRRYAKTR